MIAVVFVRYTLMTAEMLNFIDKNASHDCDEIIAQKVDGFCHQLEELMAEFNIEAIMNAKETKTELCCLIADHIMTIYAIIVGMKRLVRRSEPEQLVDTTTVRAARKVVSIILNFERNHNLPDVSKGTFGQYVNPSIRIVVFSSFVFRILVIGHSTWLRYSLFCREDFQHCLNWQNILFLAIYQCGGQHGK